MKKKFKNKGWYWYLINWYWYLINATNTDDNNSDDNTPASSATAIAITNRSNNNCNNYNNNNNNNNNNNVIIIKITTIKMKSACALKQNKKKMKVARYMVCLISYLAKKLLVSVKVICFF